MINIDFLVAGCNTRCQHCYVNGSPSKMMRLEDALLCLEKLDKLAQYIPNEVSFTLDHEPMNHPHIDQILHAASNTQHIQNFHHGMTTGIALMHRKDKDSVLQAYIDHGYHSFGITIHGNSVHHDEIVRRNGAYQTAIDAAKFLKSHGAKLELSLMLNRYFASDAETISAMISELQPNDICFAIPIFTPHNNMMDFEPHRATFETVSALQGYFSAWRQNESSLLKIAQENTIGAVVERLKQGVNLHHLFSEKQDELYLTLHQDCKLCVGNSGAETEHLGDLRYIDLQATAEYIYSLPGNRDYGAFYDIERLPNINDLIKALKKLPQSTLYGDFESVLYRGFAELGIQQK